MKQFHNVFLIKLNFCRQWLVFSLIIFQTLQWWFYCGGWGGRNFPTFMAHFPAALIYRKTFHFPLAQKCWLTNDCQIQFLQECIVQVNITLNYLITFLSAHLQAGNSIMQVRIVLTNVLVPRSWQQHTELQHLL